MSPFQPFLPHPSADHASLQPIMDPPVRSGTGDSAAFLGNDNALSRRPKVPCGTQRRHLRLILSPKGAVRYSKAALTAYSVAQRCRATLKGGTYGLFCRPKVPCDTQRRHLRGLFVAREHSDKLSREQNAPSRSRDILGRPFREQNAAFRSQDRLGRPSREQNAPFRSRDNLGRPSREQNAPSRSRDNLGIPFREQNAPFRSRDNLGRPFREQNAPSRSRDALAYPFVSRTCRFAHETTSEDPPVSRMRLFTHETTSELSCATGTLRELYGDSTGAPRCRRGETRASATHRETWCLSGR